MDSPRLQKIRQLRLLKEKIRRKAETDFYTFFVYYAWPELLPGTEYVDNWHVHAICDHMQAVTDGQIKRLIINMPFRMLKSTIISQAFPAWEWITYPHLQYMTASYSREVAIRDAVHSRRIIESKRYREAWGHVFKLTSDQNVKTRYENDRRGSRIITSTESAGTGFGGNRVMIDDPVSGRQASSAAAIAASVDWYTGTAATRMNDPEKDAMILVHQRLSQKDLTGYILETNPDGWDHLILPMRFDPERRKTTSIGFVDPRTKPGELLSPQRLGEEAVRELEKTLTSYHTAAQLQQNPQARAGGMFKRDWFPVIKEIPLGTKFVRGWDLASTEDGGDYTAGVKVGRQKNGRFVIADARRAQYSAAKVETLITNTASQDGYSTKISLPQDPGQAGKVQAGYLVGKLAGYNVTATPESGSKITRAEPFAAQAEAGNVDILEGAWNSAYFDELEIFGNDAGNDDQVDATTRAFNSLLTTNALSVWEKLG